MQATPVMEEQTKDLADILIAIRRRRTAITTIAVVIFLASALLAALLPPVYRSTATILIEEQDISTDLVRAAVSTFAVQRIQTISQRVMTRSNLTQIIQKFDLYQDDKRTKTDEEIIDAMRENIKLDTINADVMDPRSGAPTKATIAFTLSYDGENADITQQVANELTSLFLKENLQQRTQKAEESYAFLKEQADNFGRQIADFEKKLATFKEKNAANMPEMAGMNFGLKDSTTREVEDVENQIHSLKERKFYLETQLAQTDPMGPSVSSSGMAIPNQSARLRQLQNDYTSALSRYAPNHPDVLRLRREIAALEGQTGAVDTSADTAKQLVNLRTDLAAAQQKYSDDHPDIIKLRKEIAALENVVAEPKPSGSKTSTPTPDNPAYVTLQVQLNSAEQDMRMLTLKREQLKIKLAEYEARLAQSPQIEREYSDLTRGLDSAKLKFQEIKARQNEAELSKSLESESKGERFSLIDTPASPEKPVSPNRPVILLLGFLLSMGSGLGYGVLADSMDKSIRGAKGLASVLGTNPLSIIPYIENNQDRQGKGRTKRRRIMSLIGIIALALLLIHFLWMPLDVLWIKAARYLSQRFDS